MEHVMDSGFRVTGDGPIGLKMFFGTPVHECDDCGKTRDIFSGGVTNDDKYVYFCKPCGLKREKEINKV